MNPEMFYLLILIIALCMLGSVTGAYFYGFSRGAKFHNEKPDPTPEWIQQPEPVVLEELMIEVAYLPASTGPISIEAPASHGEILGSAEIIAGLTTKLARAERLRKRYLRLLREERAMMLSYFTPGHRDFEFSPYWKRWLRNRARIIDEMLAAGGWGSPEIANTQ